MNGFSSRRLKERISIGVLGTERGSGATHLVLAAANYLYSGIGRKTAVLELSGRNDLQAMVLREGNGSELLGVRYFFGNEARQVPELYNQEYEAYVLDLGVDYRAARGEFLRCDTKIVIGSISPWKASKYEYFLEFVQQETYKMWDYLVLFGYKQDKRKMEKRYGIRMKQMPFLENPFCLQREDIAFLQKII